MITRRQARHGQAVSLIDLPQELLVSIFSRLDSRAVAPVCRAFRAAIHANASRCVALRAYDPALDAPLLATMARCPRLTHLDVSAAPVSSPWPAAALPRLRTMAVPALFPAAAIPPSLSKLVVSDAAPCDWAATGAAYPRTCTWVDGVVAALDAASSSCVVVVPVALMAFDDVWAGWCAPRVRVQTLSVSSWPPGLLDLRDAARFSELTYFFVVCSDVASLDRFAGATLPRVRSLTLSANARLASLAGLRSAALPSLRCLTISSCDAVSSLVGVGGAALAQLTVRACPALTGLAGLENAALGALRDLDLSGCAALRDLRALGAAAPPALTKLLLNGCASLRSLRGVPATVLARLELLELRGCPALSHRASLARVRAAPLAELVAESAALAHPPTARRRAFPRLRALTVCNGGLATLGDLFAPPPLRPLRRSTCAQRPDAPASPPQLSSLVLSGCADVRALCAVDGVRVLTLTKCHGLGSLAGLSGAHLTQLKVVHCRGVVSLEGASAPSLTHLTVSNCAALVSLAGVDAASFPRLTSLHVRFCDALESIAGLGGGGSSGLTSLECQGCSSLSSLQPLGAAGLVALEQIRVSGNALTSLSGLGALPALRVLECDGEDALESLCGLSDACLPALTTLRLNACSALTSLCGAMGTHVPRLTRVSVSDCESLGEWAPLMRTDFVRLSSLDFADCDAVQALLA